MTNLKYIAIGQLLFAGIGFLTGWMAANDALNLAMIGLAAFGIHTSNVNLGRSLGARY